MLALTCLWRCLQIKIQSRSSLALVAWWLAAGTGCQPPPEGQPAPWWVPKQQPRQQPAQHHSQHRPLFAKREPEPQPAKEQPDPVVPASAEAPRTPPVQILDVRFDVFRVRA